MLLFEVFRVCADDVVMEVDGWCELRVHKTSLGHSSAVAQVEP